MKKVIVRSLFIFWALLSLFVSFACTKEVLVTSVSITFDETIRVSESKSLNVKVLPEDATDKSLNWSSSDESICTCKDGVINALKDGTVTIYGLNEKSKVQGKITLTILEKDSIVYTINVYDLDGEVLGKKEINSKNNANVFEDLKKNFTVKYSDSEYGPYIQSINNSIIDPNYYINVKENSTDAMVSCDKLLANDGDVFDFTNTCFNIEFTETDILVDKIVYSFMKNNYKKINEKATKYYDYTLASSVLMMINEGYDQNIFNFDFSNVNSLKEQIEKTNYQALENENDYFKYLITMVALKTDTTKLKEALEIKNSYNTWNLICTKYLKIENDALTKTLNELTQIEDPGDYGMMMILPYMLYKEPNTKVIDDTFKLATTDGIDSYGVNSSSTATFILGCIANNINVNTLTVEGVNMVTALTKYYTEEGFKWQLTDEKPDLAFSTPQAISALLAYKVMRDKNHYINIYEIK